MDHCSNSLLAWLQLLLTYHQGFYIQSLSNYKFYTTIPSQNCATTPNYFTPCVVLQCLISSLSTGMQFLHNWPLSVSCFPFAPVTTNNVPYIKYWYWVHITGLTDLFLLRPYRRRLSSREIGFRCMKLQKPPRVHSLYNKHTASYINAINDISYTNLARSCQREDQQNC